MDREESGPPTTGWVPRLRSVLAIAACASGLAVGGFVAGSATADNPLAGEWHMDSVGSAGEGISSTPDSSGNGNDLTGSLSGNVLIPGRWGNAIEFNAANFDQLVSRGGLWFRQPAPAL